MGAPSFSVDLLKSLPDFLKRDSIQSILDTGNQALLSRILDDFELPTAADHNDALTLTTIPSNVFNTTLVDIFLPIAESIFNEEMTDLNQDFIKNIGKETYNKLIAIAQGEALVNTLLSAIVTVYTKVIMNQYQRMSPEPIRPLEVYDNPSQESDDKLDEYMAKNNAWKRNKQNFEKNIINKIIQANVSKEFLSASVPPFKLEHELTRLNHLKSITNQCNDLLNEADQKAQSTRQELSALLNNISDELQHEMNALHHDKVHQKDGKMSLFFTKLEDVATTLNDKTQQNETMAHTLAKNLVSALNTIKTLKTLHDLNELTEDSIKKLASLKSICKNKTTSHALAKAERELMTIKKMSHQYCNAWKEPLKMANAITAHKDLLNTVTTIHHQLKTIGITLNQLEEKPIKNFVERFLNRLLLIISCGYRGYAGSEKNKLNEKDRVTTVNSTIQHHCSTLKRELEKIRTNQALKTEESHPKKPSPPQIH